MKKKKNDIIHNADGSISIVIVRRDGSRHVSALAPPKPIKQAMPLRIRLDLVAA
jgi:hypothetical protein